MNYAQQYVSSAGIICKQYDGAIPFAAFLKQYFAAHKKFGSRDRKHVSHLCYCFYRLGQAAPDLPFEERLRLALFLCEMEPGVWSSLFPAQWLEQWQPLLQDRIGFAQQQIPSFDPAQIFPWHRQLSRSYDHSVFSCSHLIQPDLFLRVRPGYTKAVVKKLGEAGIAFRQLTEDCIALPNKTKLDELFVTDKEVVIQDKSSQEVGVFIRRMEDVPVSVWDCCAASGGKSILAWDLLPGVRLTASDIRESIIRNLRKRFDTANVQAENIFVADLSQETRLPLAPFDLVICDAPCSGSGTWGRTPEQLYYFKEEQIGHYSSLQEKISSHVLPHIKTGGHLLYITCSVFAAENELIVEKLTEHGMKIVQMDWLKGYDQKADSMFAALLQKL